MISLVRYGGGPALPRLLRPTVNGQDQSKGEVKGEVKGKGDGKDGRVVLDLWPEVPVTTTNAKQLLLRYRQQQQDEEKERATASGNRVDNDEGNDENEDEVGSTSTSQMPPGSDSHLSLDSLSVLDGGPDGLSSAGESQTLLSGSKLLPPPQSLAEISMASADCGTNVLDALDDHHTNNHSNEDHVAAAEGATPRVLRTICFVCKSPSRLRCTGCSAVNYCSQACQRSHWKAAHKKWCAPSLPLSLLPSHSTHHRAVITLHAHPHHPITHPTNHLTLPYPTVGAPWPPSTRTCPSAASRRWFRWGGEGVWACITWATAAT